MERILMDKPKKEKGECICRNCPSFVDCNEGIAYCLKPEGKSKCIKSEVGCICPGCPVQIKMKFKHDYYCTRGNEKQQSVTNK